MKHQSTPNSSDVCSTTLPVPTWLGLLTLDLSGFAKNCGQVVNGNHSAACKLNLSVTACLTCLHYPYILSLCCHTLSIGLVSGIWEYLLPKTSPSAHGSQQNDDVFQNVNVTAQIMIYKQYCRWKLSVYMPCSYITLSWLPSVISNVNWTELKFCYCVPCIGRHILCMCVDG